MSSLIFEVRRYPARGLAEPGGVSAMQMLPFCVEAVSECRHCLLQYGDILREGWRNLVECLLQMFRVQLLPTSMMEAEDYIESSGRCGVKNFFYITSIPYVEHM
jgi:hypothetical protein